MLAAWKNTGSVAVVFFERVRNINSLEQKVLNVVERLFREQGKAHTVYVVEVSRVNEAKLHAETRSSSVSQALIGR